MADPGSSSFVELAVKIKGHYRRVLASLNISRFRLGQVWESDPHEFTVVDPSEGVGSDEIIGTIRDIFGDVEVRSYNGSVRLHALDPSFYRDFHRNRDADRRILQMLLPIEKALIQSGGLPSDHAHMIATTPG